jgi:hypothetical protein
LVWRLDEEFVKGSEDTEAGDGAIDDGGNIWIVGTYATSGDEEKDRGCGC